MLEDNRIMKMNHKKKSYKKHCSHVIWKKKISLNVYFEIIIQIFIYLL
jgi:hypothetical protein